MKLQTAQQLVEVAEGDLELIEDYKPQFFKGKRTTAVKGSRLAMQESISRILSSKEASQKDREDLSHLLEDFEDHKIIFH